MSALLAVERSIRTGASRSCAAVHEASVAARLSRERSQLAVLVPVVSELLQGPARCGRTPGERRVLVATFYEAVPANRRVTPTYDDWLDTGRALAHLATGGHDAAELRRRSFYFDVQIAAVCRKRGITLVTEDRDHGRLRAYVGHRIEPLPVRPRAPAAGPDHGDRARVGAARGC